MHFVPSDTLPVISEVKRQTAGDKPQLSCTALQYLLALVKQLPLFLQMMMHQDVAEDLQQSGQASEPMQNVSVAPAGSLQQVAVLKLAPQADGVMNLLLMSCICFHGMEPFHVCIAERQMVCIFVRSDPGCLIALQELP